MLLIPEQAIRVIAIDPGSHQCGVSKLEIDLRDVSIKKIQPWTVQVDRLKDRSKFSSELVEERVLNHYKLRDYFVDLFKDYQPHYVVYEGPFINKLQPSAYGVLMSLLTLVQEAVYRYNEAVMFQVFQPMVVKKSLKVAGKHGKEIVMQAILEHPWLKDVIVGSLDHLDHNAIDSIAVGYTFFQENIRRFKHV